MLYRFFTATFIVAFLGIIQLVSAQPIHVSPDGPTIVRLSEDAASVIVGNPAHASVVLDNPQTLLINAGVPGMTSVVVLGKNGRVIMNKPIISNAPVGDLIRVQNACINGGEGCVANKIFYCAEGERCHDVIVPQLQAEETAAQPPEANLLEDQ